MVDLVIVLAFVAYAVTAGFIARRKASRGLNDYFLAGRTLRGWQSGASMAATQFAADTPLLVAGLLATGGVFMVWRLWVYGLAFLLMGFIFASHWRRAGVLTDAELTEIRYSGRGVLTLRALKAVYYGVLINCVVLAMVLVAAMRIGEVFLPWRQWLPGGVYEPLRGLVEASGLSLASPASALPEGVATTNNLISIHVIVAFTWLYSATGGLRSVVATDVVQLTIALVGTAAYAWIVIANVGGLGELTDGLVNLYGSATANRMLSFRPTGGEALTPFLVVLSLQWLFQASSDGTGYLAQRSMACRTDRDARLAAIFFSWLQIVLRSLPWLAIGLGLVVLYPAPPGAAEASGFVLARESLFAQGIDDLLPVGLRGLMLTAMLAALASTIDTHLNWGASYWSNDLYNRLLCRAWLKRSPSQRELVLAARLSTVVILAIAFTVMVFQGSIQATWTLSLLFGAGVGSVLVLRWVWERINLWSEVAAMATSLVAAPVLLIFVEAEWVRLALMALLSTVAAVAAALLAPRTDRALLRRFYAQVQPVGFWRGAAGGRLDSDHDPVRRLARDGGAALAAAGSLFLTLYGSARLLFQKTTPDYVTPFLALLIGIALTPLWLPRAWRSDEDEQERATSTAPDRSPLDGGEQGEA